MRLLFTLLLFSILSNSFGQKIINKISNDICDCSNKLDISSLDSASATLSFEKCLSHLLYYTGDLKKKELDILDSNDLENITEKVMTELFKSCDSFLKLSLAMQSSSLKDTISKVKDTEECKIFRNGKFLSLSSEDSTITTMNSTEQMVRNPVKGTYSKYTVSWISDCEYTLTYIKGTDDLVKKFAQQVGIIRVKIMNISGDIITFLSFFGDNSYESKMKKLE